MLSLLPNERTGDHRDKPSLARPAVHTFLPIVHFTHLKLFVPKGLASFFSHLCHSLSSPSGIVFSHSGSPFPHSTTTTSHSSRVGGLSFSLETHTHTHTHTDAHIHIQIHCPGIGDNPTIQCPIIAPMCQAKHQYTAP